MNLSRLLFAIIALGAPAAIYWFLVRPRLRARFNDLYADIDSFWARWWARAVAFRTMMFGTIGLMLPELITGVAALASSDISFMPGHWQDWIRGAALVATMLGRAVATAPREQPPKG